MAQLLQVSSPSMFPSPHCASKELEEEDVEEELEEVLEEEDVEEEELEVLLEEEDEEGVEEELEEEVEEELIWAKTPCST